uniref:CSON008584 protein n=1 Tax=Culicoides sonorensis TaxID=179676 RepID=A0A336M1P1_CULSO
MAQETTVETDTGIVITNNVELSTVNTSSKVKKQTLQEEEEENQLQPSGRRHNISISSIDSNASSTASSSSSSSSESETDEENSLPCHTEIQNLANEYLSGSCEPPSDNGILPMMDDQPSHNISSIAIKNSTNVRIGNTQEFHAPVTIQQFMIDAERKKWTEVKNGLENAGYAKSLNDISSSNHNSDDQEIKDAIPHIQKKLQNYYFIGAICCCLIVGLVILITFVAVHAKSISGTKTKNDLQRGDGDDSRKNIPITSNLGYNVKSIGIAFIGTFNKIVPPPRQLAAAKLLIQEGVNQKYLASDYKLYGHRQFIATESPGNALYNIIKNWTHWSDEIDT